MQILLSMMIFCLVLSYEILNKHQFMLDSTHLLVLGLCHWQLGPLCTGLISAGLSLAGSKQRGTSYHLAWVLKQSCCTTLMCHLSQWCDYMLLLQDSSSFSNGCQNAYAIHLGRVWYGFTLSLTWNKNVSLKHPILEKKLIILITLPSSVYLTMVVMSAFFLELVIK